MTDDPGIVCFQHSCQPTTKIFCYQLPATCPCCSAQLSGVAQLMPFRLPYPFVRPHQHPCAIILKPTSGDFMNDYFNAKDLHIGVTTSAGTIVEFDERGLRQTTASSTTTSTKAAACSASSWSQSLLVDAAPEPWWEHWDEVLAASCAQPDTWSAQQYDSRTHNCYTFVLRFLQQLGWGRVSRAAHNRQEFCAEFIVPRTTTAGKYISLYRKLRGATEVGCYVHRSGDGRAEAAEERELRSAAEIEGVR